MAQNKVEIIITAQDSASKVMERLSGTMKQTQQSTSQLADRLNSSQKSWDNYAVATGAIGSSLDDFLIKQHGSTDALVATTAASTTLAGRLKGSLVKSFGTAQVASGALLASLTNIRTLLVGGAFATAVGWGVKMASDLEAAHQGYVTLLGSVEKADAALDLIKEEAKRTPFDVASLVRLNQRFTALTGDVSQSQRIINNFGKAMATMGHGGVQLEGVLAQVQQAMQKGKLEMNDIKPLQNYIDVYGIMSRNLGVSKQQLIEMQGEGKLTADMLLQAFELASNGSGEFSKAYENNANTFRQITERLKDTWGLFLVDIVEGSGAFDGIKQALIGLSDFMETHGEDIKQGIITTFTFLRENGPIIAGVIAGALTPALIGMAAALPAIAAGFAAAALAMAPYLLAGAAIGLLAKVIIDNWGPISGFFTNIWESVSTTITNVMNFVGEKIKWFKNNWAEAIGYVIGFFATLPFRLPLLMTQAIGKVIEIISKVDWPAVFNAIANAAASAFAAVWNAAVGVFNRVKSLDWGSILSGIGRGIANSIIGLIEGAIKGAASGIPVLGDMAKKLNIPRFNTGVTNFEGGLAYVHKGEVLTHLPKGTNVTPANEVRSGFAGGPTVNIGTVINQSNMDPDAFFSALAWQIR